MGGCAWTGSCGAGRFCDTRTEPDGVCVDCSECTISSQFCKQRGCLIDATKLESISSAYSEWVRTVSLFRYYLRNESGVTSRSLSLSRFDRSRKDKVCPCSELNPCADGFACVSGILKALFADDDLLIVPSVMDSIGMHPGLCLPCPPGTLCRSGTIMASNFFVVEDPSSVEHERLACPKNMYCRNSSMAIICPTGFYCPKSSSEPIPCSYQSLVSSRYALSVPTMADNVLTKIIRNQDLIAGNYCPERNATGASQPCPGGHYCPTPSELKTCPSGHFCPPGSNRPRKCYPLSRCPDGSTEQSAPPPGAIYFSVSIVVACLILPPLTKKLCKSKRKKAPSAVDVVVVTTEEIETDADHMEASDSLLHSSIYSIIYTRGMHQEPQLQLTQFASLVRRLDRIEVTGLSTRDAVSGQQWLHRNTSPFAEGKVNAIMGASGCGKSTLLDLFRGRIAPLSSVTGRVEIAGLVLNLPDVGSMNDAGAAASHMLKQLKGLRAFVPQDDILLPDLTVMEHVCFSAHLKLPCSMSKRLLMEAADAVVSVLGLGKVVDNIVGSPEKRGVSGGQRKRVSIAMEMVGMPSLLLMDEPTSGLDTTASLELLKTCGNLTHLGMTIVIVIHQPRYACYASFDNVLLLTRFGTAFSGSPAMSIAYFSLALSRNIDASENPADAILDILTSSSDDESQRLANTWRHQGRMWRDTCKNQVPMMDDALLQPCTLDDKSKNALSALLAHTSAEYDCDAGWCCTESVRDTFKIIGIPVTVHEARALVSLCNTRYNKLRELRNEHARIEHIIMEVYNACSECALESKYDNVLHRVALFCRDLPRPIMDTVSEGQQAVAVARALRFGRRLMQRVGLLAPKKKAESAVGVDKETLLKTAMTVRAMYQRAESHHIRLHVAEICCRNPMTTKSEQNTIRTVVCHILVIIRRRSICVWRSSWWIQFVITLIASLIVGAIQGSSWSPNAFPGNVAMAMACLGTLSAVTHARTLSGGERLFFRRETDSSTCVLSYHIAYGVVDIVWVTLMPLLFCVPYYMSTLPNSGFPSLYCCALMVCWWCSGMAYAVSSLPITAQWVNLISVFVAVVFGAFLNGLKPSIADVGGGTAPSILSLSYNRWALEILVASEAAALERDKPNKAWGMLGGLGLCGVKPLSTWSMGLSTVLRLLRIITTNANGISAECSPSVRVAYIALLVLGVVFRALAILLDAFYASAHLQRMIGKCEAQCRRTFNLLLKRTL